jgi:VCBS repeat-containing protein
VNEGASGGIATADLEVTDADNTPAELTYTVTVVPGNGQLELTTGPGTAITSFTQADIDAGRLIYVHDDSETTSDSFTFTVSDGAGGSLGATVFNIVVNPMPDTPAANDNAYSVNEDTTLTVDWWDTSWTKRQQLTFTNGAQNENLTDFPVLVKLNAGNIDYAQTQNNGEDLRFFDANGTSLVYEIEEWNEAGDSFVWVKVPQIDGLSDADFIWMYYGNAGASPGQTPTGVWSNSYAGVWHLDEEQGGTGNAGVYTDSTANVNHGIDNVSATGQDGQVSTGQQFDGVDDMVSVSDPGGSWEFADGGLDAGTSDFTISAWIKLDPSISEGFPTIVYKGGGSDTNDGYWFNWGKSGDTLDLRISDGTNRSILQSNAGLGLADNTWHHVSVVLERQAGNDIASFYVDGSPAGTDSLALIAGNTITGTEDLEIGGKSVGNLRPWLGGIDEVRVSSGLRSADWIAAQHLSMTDAFVTFGGETSAPATSGVIANDTDPEGDPLNAILVSGPSNAASFTFNADGTFTYTPTSDFNGTDTFTYKVNDGTSDSNVATATITVNPQNDDPVVNANTGITLAEGATGGIATAALEVTDVDNVAADLAYTVTVVPGNGQLELTTGPGTAITSFTQADIDAGRLVYVHNDSNTTSDSFTFTVSDGAGGSLGATVFSITVTAVDDDPPVVAANTGSTVLEAGTDPIPVTELEYTDTEQGPASVAYTVTTIPGNGQLELTTGPGTAITSFTQADIDAGLLVYVHNGGETTSDSFTFTVDDGQGNSVAGQVFNLTVTPQNDPPLLGTNAGITVNEGATGGIATVALEVTDVDNVPADLAYTVTVVPGNGQLELTTGPGTAITSFTQADIDANRLVYVHNGGETTTDSFTFTVVDGAGGTIGATVFNITVTPQNDDPVVNANTGITLAEGATGGIATAVLEVTDVDNVAADLAYTVTVVPGNGQLELTTGPGHQ